jgi:hypothetical protein
MMNRSRCPAWVVLGLVVVCAGCGTSSADARAFADRPLPPPPYDATSSAGPSGEEPTPGSTLTEQSLEGRSLRRGGGMRLAAQSHTPPPPPSGEKVVVSGEVNALTEDVSALAAAIRAHAAEAGGEIASDLLDGDAEHARATLVLRLPPDGVGPFVDWLAARATLDARRLEATDVSRKAVDQALAIHNLEITMARLQELAQRPNAALKDVIDIEREMTRVRGDLERIRGEQSLLADRVARATLTIGIYLKRGVHVEPELKFELVPHLTLLHFLDSGARTQTRGGGGVSLMFSRWFSLEMEVLPRHAGDARSFLFTASVASYSDFLGGGRRRFFNPYLGLRAGGGTVNDFGTFAYGADVGLEIVHYKMFLVEIVGRAMGLRYHHDVSPHGDIVLEGILGAGVPF